MKASSTIRAPRLEGGKIMKMAFVLRDYFAKGFDASHPKICFPLSAFRAPAVASGRSVSKAAEQHLGGIGIKVNYSDKTDLTV